MPFKEFVVPSVFIQGQKELRPLDREVLRVFGDLVLNLKGLLRRGLRFESEVDCRMVDAVTHGTPGTEFSVAHGLGKIPVGYMVNGQTAPGSLYDGTTANTATTLYLRSDAAGATFRLIVI